MTLDRDDVEAIARRVAELLRTDSAASAQYVDAAAIAERFGVGRAWVYAHKRELGAVALGDGAKPRLRFDVKRVEATLRERREEPARKPRRRRRTPRRHAGAALLPYDGM